MIAFNKYTKNWKLSQKFLWSEQQFEMSTKYIELKGMNVVFSLIKDIILLNTMMHVTFVSKKSLGPRLWKRNFQLCLKKLYDVPLKMHFNDNRQKSHIFLLAAYLTQCSYHLLEVMEIVKRTISQTWISINREVQAGRNDLIAIHGLSKS